MSAWSDWTAAFAWVMLEHPTSLAVFTSGSRTGRLKTTGGTLPRTSSILRRRITNRSLLSTTYPQPKLTLTYCVETVGERAEGVFDLLVVFLTLLAEWNFLFNRDAAWRGKQKCLHFLYYKERKICAALWALTCLQCPRSMWNLCKGRSITAEPQKWRGTHLSPLLRLNLEVPLCL